MYVSVWLLFKDWYIQIWLGLMEILLVGGMCGGGGGVDGVVFVEGVVLLLRMFMWFLKKILFFMFKSGGIVFGCCWVCVN